MRKLATPAFAVLFLLPALVLAQAPDLGTAANFVIFTTTGAIENTSISHLTGKVGTNNGSTTGFGNVNGGMHSGDGMSAQAATDLLLAYDELNAAIPGSFLAPGLGGGQILNAGVHSIDGAATLNSELFLDAQNNPSAVFIFQIGGPFSTNPNSKVVLLNGAQACNVYWKVEGLVDMASGTTMRGSVIANNAAINMNVGDTLEGRALSTAGAITLDGVLAYLPAGCGSPLLTGPTAPIFGEVGCYGIFSADGPVENAGITTITGSVGANVGLTTGFDPLLVTGDIHPIPDASTAEAAADLSVVYNYLNGLAHDIELLYPAQFGGNLVLTPHTYVLNGATTLTDTLYLNAEENTDAVFIVKIYGALSTSTYSNVVLRNGTQAKNVYWLVNGAVSISDYSIFNGTIVSQGAINLLTGVQLNGRALTGAGALATNAINGDADIDATDCSFTVSVGTNMANETVSVHPNPFNTLITITIEQDKGTSHVLIIYNALGKEVINKRLTNSSTTLDTSVLPAGAYLYRVAAEGRIIHSGSLIAE